MDTLITWTLIIKYPDNYFTNEASQTVDTLPWAIYQGCFPFPELGCPVGVLLYATSGMVGKIPVGQDQIERKTAVKYAASTSSTVTTVTNYNCIIVVLAQLLAPTPNHSALINHARFLSNSL